MAIQSQSSDNSEAGPQSFARRFIVLCQSQPATLLICTLFTFVMMYNYVFPLGSLLYTTGIKGQDCGQMIWNIWFANEAITSGHSPFSTNLVSYPLGANLAHHTLAAGFFPITFLVKLISGGSPMYPFYAYKIIILFSFTLILWFSYLTLREIGLKRWVALVPAVGYAFSDFYKVHVIHINHLAGFFIPLTALFLIRAYKKPASANLMLAALAAGCSVYFTEFSISICLAAALFLLFEVASGSGRNEFAFKMHGLGASRLLKSAIIFAVIVAPFVFVLFRDQVRKPLASESSHYSANLAGFFIPGQEREEAGTYGAALPEPPYGRVFGSLDSRITVGVGGFETFVGFPLLLFSVIALARCRSREFWICGAVGLFFFLLSLGPTLKIFGAETKLPMPYAVLMKIPPFDTGRTPVRFVVMGLFFFMIVAACGLSRLQMFLAVRVGQRWSSVAMLLIFAWTTAEVYSATPRRPRFGPPANLVGIAPGPVLNLPPMQWDGYAAMLQTFHRQPIATGYLARNSEAQWAQFAALKTAFDRGGSLFCDYVKRNGFRTLVISPDSVMMPYQQSMSPLELSDCAVNVVDLRERGPGPFGIVGPGGSERPVDFPIYPLGTRINFGTAAIDKYLWYGWSGREEFSHWTDRGKATLVFSLSTTEVQKKITLRIFGAPFLAPGKLDSQRVLITLNNQQLGTWNLNSADARVQSIEIPPGAIREKNTLMFIVPDAASPQSLGVSDDARLLGMNIQWIEID